MSSERYAFTEDNGGGGNRKGTGCFVSIAIGFLLTFLAVAIAVGVGIIVHFADNSKDEVKCRVDFPNVAVPTAGQNGDTSAPTKSSIMSVSTSSGMASTVPSTWPTISWCQQQAQNGNYEICSACPSNSCSPISSQPPPIATTSQSPSQQDSLRLPSNVKPLYYSLELQPNMYWDDPKTFTFIGHVNITIECLNSTSEIVLHSKTLTLSTIQVTADNGDGTSFVSYALDASRDLLTVKVSKPLTVGQRYKLDIRFFGPLTDDLAGLYLSQYTRDGKIVYMATTQFESTDARKAFPCFDEPSLKANFSVTLVRKSYMSSISNLPLLRQEPRADNMVADAYLTSPPMSTYLLAFIVSDFQYVSKNSSTGVMYRVWARPDAVEQTRYALDIGIQILHHYEELFNISFPLPKQDMIAIPDFANGAMENWGLITYRESDLLYSPGQSSASQKQRVTLVIAHELAHMWFGDLLTPAWWDDLWLNEGFASFVQFLGQDFIYPEWKMLDQFVIDDVQSVFNFDGHVNSHPISIPGLQDVRKIEETFDTISYEKGASVIRMLRFFLGEDTFSRGIISYLKAHMYSNANHEDLWKALTEQAMKDGKNINVSDVMNTWILQQNYPVVTVAVDGNSLKLTQQRFLASATDTGDGNYPSPYSYKWEIPFTYTTSREMNFNVTYRDVNWMPRNQPEVRVNSTEALVDPSSGGWILGNVRQYGVYRVNYDVSNWKALLGQLKSQHDVIYTTNRAQIINDAWNLAGAELLEPDIALATLEYLDTEQEYVPWAAAYNEIATVMKRLGHTELYGAFEKFLIDKTQSQFTRLGLQNLESLLDSYLQIRVVTLACQAGLTQCVQQAKTMFSRWKSQPTDSTIIPPQVRYRVWCTAIESGTSEDWEFLYQRYLQETVPVIRNDLMHALACSDQPWILSTLLQRSMDATIFKKQDAAQMIYYVTQNTIGQPLAWEFIKANWPILIRDYSASASTLSRMILGSVDTFSTDTQIAELEDFISSRSDLSKGETAFRQALETAKLNKRWMETIYPKIKTWLTDLGYFGQSSNQPNGLTDFRLPLDLTPEHYDVEITPLMYDGPPENFTFHGSVSITFLCVNTTNKIVLHSVGLDLTNTSLMAPSGGTVPRYTSLDLDADREFLIVDLDGNLTAGVRYILSMNFQAPLAGTLKGLYLSSYTENGVTKYMATTQFEATDARRAFPCFDEPAMKASFNITLVRGNDFKALSNMPIAFSESRKSNMTADIFLPTPKMSTYLVAFIIADFSMKSNRTANGIQYEVWARPSMIDQADFALEIGMATLTYYEEFFNISFPLPKQAMVAIPDFAAGAMENWGLITYRETAMLYQENVSSIGNKETVTLDVVHELAHQWFGNLVSPEWWDDIWLNEGFATFVEYLIGTTKLFPEWDEEETFIYDAVYYALDFDSHISSHPIYVPVSTSDQINEIFDAVSYEKGGSILRMTQFFLGKDTFRHGVIRYLKSRQYSNANHNDLWKALADQAKEENPSIAVNVVDVLDTWTLQMNYPVVTVVRTESDSLVLSQSRYVSDPQATDPGIYPSPLGYRWIIPFTYTSSSNPKFNQTEHNVTWIPKDGTNVTISNAGLSTPGQNSSWFLGNILQYGFYRVNYQESNWLALVAQLMRDPTVIHTINRAQIINDAWNLAKAGLLRQEIALKTVEYLTKETQLLPLRAAVSELGYVAGMLSRSAIYGNFKKYMSQLLAPLYNKTSTSAGLKSPKDSFLLTTITSAACGYGVLQCVDNARNLVKTWMMSPNSTNPVPADIRGTVYCTAVAVGDVSVYEFILARYQTESNTGEQSRLRAALTCSREPYILSSLLQKALDSNFVRKQDAYTLVSSIGTNSVGLPLAWSFIVNNWDTVFKTYGTVTFLLSRIATGITQNFNTQSELDQLETFVNEHSDLGTAQRAFQQAVETTRSNVRWMAQNYVKVQSWLASNGYPS